MVFEHVGVRRRFYGHDHRRGLGIGEDRGRQRERARSLADVNISVSIWPLAPLTPSRRPTRAIDWYDGSTRHAQPGGRAVIAALIVTVGGGLPASASTTPGTLRYALNTGQSGRGQRPIGHHRLRHRQMGDVGHDHAGVWARSLRLSSWGQTKGPGA